MTERWKKGSMTVFFSLILTIVLSVICTSLEAARKIALSYFTAQAQSSALESVFAGYYRPLWDEYHLFFMADGPGLLTELETYFSYYEAANEGQMFSFAAEESEILNLKTAVENHGRGVLEQITADVKSHGKEAVFSEMSGWEPQVEAAEKNADYIEDLLEYGVQVDEIERQYGKMETQGNELLELYEKAENLWGDNGISEAEKEKLKESAVSIREEAETAYGEFENLTEKLKQEVEKEPGSEDLAPYIEEEGSRRKEVESVKGLLNEKTEILESILSEPSDGQKEKIRAEKEILETRFEQQKKEETKSHSLLENFKNWKNESILSLVIQDIERISEKELIQEEYVSEIYQGKTGNQEGNLFPSIYMTEHFGCYGKEKEGSCLAYEAEYILGKSDNDRENLAAVAEKILALRSGMNFLYLLGDHQKSMEADALAAALVGFTGIVPLVRFTAKLILGAWALAEAILDTRALFQGESVPLIKQSTDWKTSLSNAAGAFTGTISENEKKTGEDGWNYERYLQLLYLMKNGAEGIYRMMDLMEANLRQKDSGFFMENCISGAEVETRFSSGRYEYRKTAVYGYQ